MVDVTRALVALLVMSAAAVVVAAASVLVSSLALAGVALGLVCLVAGLAVLHRIFRDRPGGGSGGRGPHRLA